MSMPLRTFDCFLLQAKKLEMQEAKKTNVEKLIKMSTKDAALGTADWSAQYNARKAEALKRMEEGGDNRQVGSMSAFHSGPYGSVASGGQSVS